MARHGEATPDGELTPAGRQQAALLGARLASVPLAGVFHSPVARAARTASIVVSELGDVPMTETELLDDYPPTDRGYRALAEFTALEPRVDLLITHSQIVAWFVRAALDAPEDRWVGMNAANAGLTVIQYREGFPPSLLVFNDLSHLPRDLWWTGFPEGRFPR